MSHPFGSPSLILPFTQGFWDPRLSLTRASVATYVDRRGVLRMAAADTPRLDHDPVTGEGRGLLVEERRTNLLTRSDAVEDATWTKARVSVSANSATAPDGTTTADEIVEDTESGSHSVRQTVSHAPGPLTASLFVRPGAKEGIRLQIYNATDGTIAYVDADLSAGSIISSVGAASVTALSNGWYSVACTGVAAAAASTVYVFLLNMSESPDTTYTGDGASGLHIWGAQLEEGAFPTSYIPTTTAAATRQADVCVLEGDHFADVWNAGEGTVVVAFRDGGGAESARIAVFSNNSLAGNSVFLTKGGSGTQVQLQVYSGGALIANPAVTASGAVTVAAAFAADDVAIAVGDTLVTDTSGPTPTGIDRLSLGSSVSANVPFNGHIAHLALYPRRLDNATLQALTA